MQHNLLNPSARRAAVALMIVEQAGDFGAALLVVDTLDAVGAAVCRAAGLDDDTARVVLGELWQLTALTDPREGQFRVIEELPEGAEPVIVRGYNDRPGACPCECNAGGFCGGCGHAGCGGRQ